MTLLHIINSAAAAPVGTASQAQVKVVVFVQLSRVCIPTFTLSSAMYTGTPENIQLHDLQQQCAEEALRNEEIEFFARYKSWQQWFPRGGLDTETQQSLEAYLGWLEIYLQGAETVEAIVARKNNIQAIVVWIWWNLEHLSDDDVQKVMVAAAVSFKETTGWCAVFHPEIYLKEIKKLHNVASKILQRSSRPTAMAKFVQMASASGSGTSFPS